MEYELAIFAALADPIRLRIVALIARETELCVCECVQALDLPQPKVSRHLAILRDKGLLRDRRDAQWVLYGLTPDLPGWARKAVDAAAAAMAETPVHMADLDRLSRANRPARLRAPDAA